MEEQSKNTQTTGAGTSSLKKIKQIRNRFSSKNIALMAVFVAFSYAFSFLEIPLFPAVPFLKLDFGNMFILLISFLLGPIEGVIVCVLKEGLRCITSSSMCAGELANFLTTTGFLLLPSILYQSHRNLKTVLFSLSVSCLIATAIALIVNRTIVFPVYAFLFGGSIFGMTVVEAYSQFFGWILLFNLIKTASISILTVLLYKRLSNFFKKMR